MKQIIYCFFLLFLTVNLYHANAQSAEEKKMLTLVNNLRSDNGLSALRFNTSLNTASKKHSQDMAKNDYFSHKGLNGSQFWERANDEGYSGFSRAENIAAGYSSAEDTFNQWVTSSGHLSNMLLSDINEMGIGYAYDRSATYGHYWTQMFGRGTTLSNEDVVSGVTKVSIYPNPTTDKINILTSGLVEEEIEIELFSVTGKSVLKQSKKINSEEVSFNIEHLPSGLYFLKLKGSNKLYKIVKSL